MTNAEKTGPLAGVRVIDMTHYLAGPYCTVLLGDLGADVVKVEPPQGDPQRAIGPRRSEGMSSHFLTFNRNKRSIALDLKSDEGKAALSKLIEGADVFVTNMRRPAVERLGFTYDDVQRINPSIVYCNIVGLGSEQPKSDRQVVDDIIQAMSGIASLQEQASGKPGYVALSFADSTTALTALYAILAALFRRERTGEGEEIEVPMYDAVASYVMNHMWGGTFEPPTTTPTNPRLIAPNRKPFKTADGSITITPYAQKDWITLLDILGRSELLEDPRFSTLYERAQHMNELYGLIEPLLLERTTDEWFDLLLAADIGVARVQTPEEVLADEGLRAAGLFPEFDHPTEGRIRLVANPVRYRNAPCSVWNLPPNLGADTADVLRDAGLGQEEIDKLVAADDGSATR